MRNVLEERSTIVMSVSRVWVDAEFFVCEGGWGAPILYIIFNFLKNLMKLKNIWYMEGRPLDPPLRRVCKAWCFRVWTMFLCLLFKV